MARVSRGPHLKLLQLRLRDRTPLSRVAAAGAAAKERRGQQAATLLTRLPQLSHLKAGGHEGRVRAPRGMTAARLAGMDEW